MNNILTILASILFIYSQGVCNAKEDGWTWDNLYGDKRTFGMSQKYWHAWKLQKRIFFGLALFLKGYLLLEVGFAEISLMLTFESIIAWALWHQVYYYTRYGDFWDTKHAKNIIYIPSFGKDRFISLMGRDVIWFHIIRYVIGILGIIVTQIIF